MTAARARELQISTADKIEMFTHANALLSAMIPHVAGFPHPDLFG